MTRCAIRSNWERERDCGGAASQSVGKNISGDCAPQHRVPINGNWENERAAVAAAATTFYTLRPCICVWWERERDLLRTITHTKRKPQTTMFFFLFLGIESETQIGTRFNFDSIQKTQSWALTLITSSSSSSMRGGAAAALWSILCYKYLNSRWHALLVSSLISRLPFTRLYTMAYGW